MRKLIFGLLLTVIAAPAWACSCVPDNGTQGAALLTNSNMSVADVYVRGMNVNNGQSMLEIKSVRSGGLMARNIRAKFDRTSCGTVPQYKKNMTLLIKFEDDGSYSIPGQCEQMAVMKALKGQ